MPGDDATPDELAARLNRSSAEEAARFVARCIDLLHVDTVGALMDKLPPSQLLDYHAEPIRLQISSGEILLRLLSVEKEPFTVEWIEQSIKPGDVFYDIGANVGAYSLIAAKATGNRARIYAFEPSPASFNDLTRNVQLNDCNSSVVALPFALWSRTGTLSLLPVSPFAGAAQHRIARSNSDEAAVTILALRLDDAIEWLDLPVPTHAKVDTDGYEAEVLLGAERTLARPEWKTIIELDPEETPRNRQIKKMLAAAGFTSSSRHARESTPHFPNPAGRPDVYWTFRRPASDAHRTRRGIRQRPHAPSLQMLRGAAGRTRSVLALRGAGQRLALPRMLRRVSQRLRSGSARR